MSTTTTRAGLVKPSGSASPAEYVDVTVLNNNADKIDKLLGCILVNDGVIPADADLIDGAIVREKTSGIIWEARANGGGGFDKVYIRYPLVFEGYTGPTSYATNVYPNFTASGVATVTTARCKNTSAANVTSGRFVVPVKGIYSVYFRTHWSSTSVAGVRGMTVELNSSFLTAVGTNYTKEVTPVTGSDTVVDFTFNRLFAVNDAIATGIYQSSGGNLSCSQTLIQVTLIEPVQ